MEFILKALTSPVTYVLIAACLILTLWKVNGDLQHKLTDQAAAVRTMNDTVNGMKANQDIIMGDQKSLGTLMAKKQNITQAQASISGKIEAIPDTSSCKPFDDQNTLDAARLLRDYQSETLK